MFYSTNQSYHWKFNQSEIPISGRLANPIVRIEPIRRVLTYNIYIFFIFFSIFLFFPFHFFFISFFSLFFFYISLIISDIFFHTTFSTSNSTKFCTMVVASTGFSKSMVTNCSFLVYFS